MRRVSAAHCSSLWLLSLCLGALGCSSSSNTSPPDAAAGESAAAIAGGGGLGGAAGAAGAGGAAVAGGSNAVASGTAGAGGGVAGASGTAGAGGGVAGARGAPPFGVMHCTPGTTGDGKHDLPATTTNPAEWALAAGVTARKVTATASFASTGYNQHCYIELQRHRGRARMLEPGIIHGIADC